MYVENEHGIYVPYYFSRNQLGRLEVPAAVPNATMQQIGWVPTNEDEFEPWAEDQYDRWVRPQVEQALNDLRTRAESELALELRRGLPMTQDDNVQYLIGYVQQNGFPTNVDQGVDLLLGFLDAQGESLGIHPAYLHAADFLIDMPLDSPEAVMEWTRNLGISIAQQYGIPIPDQLNFRATFMASLNAAMMQAGQAYAAIVTVGIQALWDGVVTADEVRSIVVTTGAVIGAAVGQMFGIPAPIGAFIASVVTGIIYDWLGGIFGWGPSASSKRAAAIAAAERALEAMEDNCYELAKAAWLEYNYFWNELEDRLQESLDAQGEWLSGGLRYFGETSLDALCRVEQSPCPEDEQVPLHRPINVRCADTLGCLYPYREGFYARRPRASRETLGALPNIMPQRFGPGAKADGRVDARAALSFYGAERYVTPMHAAMQMKSCPGGYLPTTWACGAGRTRDGETRWAGVLHTDEEYLRYLAQGALDVRDPGDIERMQGCAARDWAPYLLQSLAQCGPAQALVIQDISKTVTAAMAEYRIETERQVAAAQSGRVSDYETARAMAQRAAQYRIDLLRLRRQGRGRNRRINGGLAAAGVGALGGWALSRLVG